MHDIELGVGEPIGISRADHQGLHKVWGSRLDATGHYQPLELD